MNNLILGIICLSISLFLFYISNKIKMENKEVDKNNMDSINLEKFDDIDDIISFRNYLIKKGDIGKQFLLNNKEEIEKKFGYYNLIFLLKTYVFGIDKKIKRGEW